MRVLVVTVTRCMQAPDDGGAVGPPPPVVAALQLLMEQDVLPLMGSLLRDQAPLPQHALRLLAAVTIPLTKHAAVRACLGARGG